MIETDVALYLAAASLGISLAGTSGPSDPSIYDAPFPTGSADYSACVIPYAGSPAIRAMGASTTSPVAEVSRFQVVIRHNEESYGTARTLAENVYSSLDHLSFTSTAGTRYLYVKALSPVYYIGPDENGRHRFSVNCETKKERG